MQSVSLRIIVEREMEIEAFRAQEYWSVRAMLETPRGQSFEARLTQLGGKKVERMDLGSASQASIAVHAVTSRELKVASVEAKPGTRNPAPPFMTSTLQQEASRKFGFGAQITMRAAQRLYEAGHITYMRTDGIDMAPEAVHATRDAIKDRYGAEYVPGSPRMYKNKAKNAQEAHECIRPTDMAKAPADLKLSEEDQRKLYELIWTRTIASQMEAARLERTTVEIASEDGHVGLRATGQVILFDGFLKVYEEGRDDVETEDDKRLPQMTSGDALVPSSGGFEADFTKATEGALAVSEGVLKSAEGGILSADGAVFGQQHFTNPPPRYTEATLVKKMEELGIGRPSTYASIVTTIQDRGYVRKDKNRLIPEDKGRLVTAFLMNYFRRYVGYEFTAELENELDEVSAGDADYKDVLGRFWRDFSASIEETSELRITDVLEKINEVLEPHLFPPKEDGSDPRLCPKCGEGRLSMRTARSGGAFIGCSNYPECRFTRPMAPPSEDGDAAALADGKLLGHDPDTGEPVTLRSGRFGPYVQLGEPTEEVKKPPRASLPKGWEPDAIDLDKALTLLSLPRLVGDHPEGGEIKSNFGRFGPYIMHQLPDDAKPVYVNLTDPNDVFEIGMNRAVEMLAEKRANPRGGRGGGAAAKPLKELGDHPERGGPVNVMPGRYGPYVKWEKVNATIPKDVEPETVTMEMAVELIAEREAKGGKKKTTRKKKAS